MMRTILIIRPVTMTATPARTAQRSNIARTIDEGAGLQTRVIGEVRTGIAARGLTA